MTLGERINFYRKQKLLSQEQLAGEIGVSRQAVSKWEQDAALPEIDKLIALSQLFSVSTDVLLGLKAEASEQASPAVIGEELHSVISFLRKLWHNIGYFLLVWGAAIAAASLCVIFIWQEMEMVFVRAVLFMGIIAFVCGLVLVLFRIIRKSSGL